MKETNVIATGTKSSRHWHWVVAIVFLVIGIAVVSGVVSYHRFYHHTTQQEISHVV